MKGPVTMSGPLPCLVCAIRDLRRKVVEHHLTRSGNGAYLAGAMVALGRLACTNLVQALG